MKHVRMWFAFAVAIAAMGIAPSAGAASRLIQTTEGSVALMSRFPADATYSSYPKPQRDIWNQSGQNGQLGYVLPIDPRTWGGAFKLALTSGATGREDLDITFYTDLAPTPGGTAVSPGASETRMDGGESGIVPSSATHALVTLFMGANATFVYRGYAPAPLKKLKSASGALPKPGIWPNFGKDRKAPIAISEKKKSHVVIAVIDTGINPYHVTYRRPELTAHPSTYIDGFPKDAPALSLTLGAKSYVKARNADDAPVWSKVAEHKLYWIPGTNIIGAYSTGDYFDTTPGIGDSSIADVAHMPRPIIDDSGHGTGTTSVSTGAIYGSNPDALVVIVEGLGPEGVRWAAQQPWIDFISGSYGDPAAVPYNKAAPKLPTAPQPAGELDGREYESTGPFVQRDGRTACFSAGNGLSRTGAAYDRWSSVRPTSGPSWVITVGAASPRNDQDYGWHSTPVDVSSYGNYWPAADYASTDGTIDFSGTSSATPVTCGVFSKALLEARKVLRDTAEGIQFAMDGTSENPGIPVAVPAMGRRGRGLLADGILTRMELQDAVLKTARPAGFDPVTYAYEPVPTLPDTPVYYTQEGYGIANKASALRAVDVILGRAEMPDRAEVDRWISSIDMVRNQIWSPADYSGE